MKVRLLEGDALVRMAEMPADSIDACVTDPPYGLSFMAKAWDHGVPGVPYWSEVLRVSKPGAHLLAFGGTRTYHRLTCAIEDSGFQIRDCLMWLYGSGFPKGKGCLKPGWEPIILARKPAPAPWLNVDGCRLAGIKNVPASVSAVKNGVYGDMSADRSGGGFDPNLGRWPANVVLDEEAAAALDEQSGERGGSGRASGPTLTGCSTSNSRGQFNGVEATPFYGDTGGASRFFYTAKASPAERGSFNSHPTVKPLALMQWLVRLVTPTGGTVLDPFCGSGSTLVAADREGFDAIGIDSDPHAVEITRRRVTEDARMFAEVS